MRDRPDAADLLATARKAVLDELVPLLPPEAQYVARMAANAMAVALRELGTAPADEAAERRDLRVLFGRDADTADVADLGRRLAREIRSGRHDASAEVHAILLADVRRRLALCNPRAIESPPA